MKSAIVFGATGLVGLELLKQLTADNYYSEVIIYTRHKVNFEHSKIIQRPFDIQNIDKIKDQLNSDHIFCCLGSTQKKAGSRKQFEAIDLLAPVKIAEFAAQNNVESYIVISALGAKKDSPVFYNRVKGKMEQEVIASGIKNTKIVRPSLLLGKRTEFRTGEEIGKFLYSLFGVLFIGKLKKYKAIHAFDVAKAMIILAKSNEKKTIFESFELNKIAANGRN